ncbi:hypothetical protein OS493_008531 [Desmophyllum pertusum]|uniref:Menorin-like domain-containing protein n=1 Tax=Desmophyllum pertusum TaxID=174260 RepID=A0A9W9ZR67_9CNID|nr:hypothetical protein OS493_008531 [Desmophyllum pertusum]
MIYVLIAATLGLLYPSVTGEETCKFTHHQDARDDILAFFKLRDALDITWLHAVNSPERLQQGLSGETMMLEADVLMRNNMVNGTPVMAHPPDMDSNLTLASFLRQTTASTKGIKLDFKTIMVVEPSLKMIQNVTSGQEVKNPIWLNADILPGPCYDKVCVPVAPSNSCPSVKVLPMGQLVSQIAQPVTFPVRAILVRRSLKQLHWLLDLSQTFTITIWSSTTDDLDVQDIVALRQSVLDKRRIYYDLPPDQEKAFKDALASNSDGREDGRDFFTWKAARATKHCKDVLVGHNNVMFSGDGGQVISKNVLYKISAKYFQQISGIVSFIDTGGVNNKRSISIKLHVKDITGKVTNSQVVTLVLHSNGIFQLSINDADKKQGSVQSETGVFEFVIWESSSDGKKRSFKCEITAKDSEGDVAFVTLATESEPMGGHMLISAGTQSDAILVQNVETVLGASHTAGAGTAQCFLRISAAIILSVLFHSLLHM